MNDAANENYVANYRINNKKATTSRSFDYKTKVTDKIPAIASRLDTEVIVPLKHLGKFWRFLDLPLINSETGPDLSCSNLLIQLVIHLLTVLHQHKQLVQHFK